ncbi:MAG: bifunctional phosphopantothenoylcysteine decarboxylase/phosphopantothenate--cysteine ligase CoaBC [Myxococcota bacterium]|jgi:phosphopantothenoylcysteine decarboxylase/phosphopantothenate--cysteine ligase|nr:bifunctional phosphopantothenoylcysteine decarboxylase/phosphopantothenate--cysteine ligase CoaBC [Myxococcota bacterium]
MKDLNILLGVTGGIAAYKSAELCRLFVKAGARVQVVMSQAATEFITPLTFQTLSGRPVHVSMFGRVESGVEHIDLANSAELMVVAPATADYLARAATGRASDLISSVTLAFAKTVLAAPSMNTNMWNNPATVANLATLASRHGWHFVEPGAGELACGTSGAGRMAEPSEIFAAASALARRDMEGLRLLVTAGPTVEDIDPVRFISNRSTGKMGYAVARAAARRGAHVELVSGPVNLPHPAAVECISVRSALELEAEVRARASSCDAIVMTAAVADFRPAAIAPHKLKKAPGEDERTIALVRNPDILAGLGALYGEAKRPLLVGFAVETQDLLEAAKAKLAAKKAHLLVANLASDGFGGDTNRAQIIDRGGNARDTGKVSKDALADLICDSILEKLLG